jgi:hypothetical protein
LSKFKCIPWIAHEEAMWLKDRVIKRLIRGIAAIGVACVISNVVWIYKLYEKG